MMQDQADILPVAMPFDSSFNPAAVNEASICFCRLPRTSLYLRA
jgi:hypothetical protein